MTVKCDITVFPLKPQHSQLWEAVGHSMKNSNKLTYLWWTFFYLHLPDNSLCKGSCQYDLLTTFLTLVLREVTAYWMEAFCPHRKMWFHMLRHNQLCFHTEQGVCRKIILTRIPSLSFCHLKSEIKRQNYNKTSRTERECLLLHISPTLVNNYSASFVGRSSFRKAQRLAYSVSSTWNPKLLFYQRKD